MICSSMFKVSLLILIFLQSIVLISCVIITKEMDASRTYCDTSGKSAYISESINATLNTRNIITNSCPNHYSVCQEGNCEGVDATFAIEKTTEFVLPLYPRIASMPTDKTCSSGPVGVALNGVQIFSQFDDILNPTTHTCQPPRNVGPHVRGNSCPLLGETDGTKYCGDSVAQYGHTFDKCGGHAERLSGIYHYHTLPVCLLNQILSSQSNLITNYTNLNAFDLLNAPISQPSTEFSIANQEAYGANSQVANSNGPTMQHSPQIGWALDGFPIYGPRGPGGMLMFPCADTANDIANGRGIINYTTPLETLKLQQTEFCLDMCNGYYGTLPNIDSFTYRYYISGGGDGFVGSDIETTTSLEEGVMTSHVKANPYSLDGVYGHERAHTKEELLSILKNNHDIGVDETLLENCSSYVINSDVGTCDRYLKTESYSNIPEICCIQSVPSKVYAPYTIGCLRGCTVEDHASGVCIYADHPLIDTEINGVNGQYGHVKMDNSQGTTSEYIPEISSIVNKIYDGRTVVATVTTPVDSVNTDTNVDTVTKDNVTITYRVQETSTVFRYASNHSLAVLHTTTTMTNTESTDVPVIHRGDAASNIKTPTRVNPTAPLGLNNSINTLTYSQSIATVEDIPVSRIDDAFFLSMASTEQNYQQLLSTHDNSDVSTVDRDGVVRLDRTVEQTRKEQLFTIEQTNVLQHQLKYVSRDFGVFSIAVDQVPIVNTHVVKGYLTASVFGYNFGRSASDIKLFTIRDIPCSSVVYYSSTHLDCILSQIDQNLLPTLIPEDVYLETIAGSMRGVYLLPKVMFKSGNNRPIIADIQFGDTALQNFKPYAIALSPTMSIFNSNKTDILEPPWLLQASQVNQNQLNGHMYVSLLAGSSVQSSGNLEHTPINPDTPPPKPENWDHPVVSGGSIVRCDYAGSKLRPIVTGVAKVYGLTIYQPSLMSNTESTSVPPVAPPFTPHDSTDTGTNMGLIDSIPRAKINASYVPPYEPYSTVSTTTNNDTVTEEILFYVESVTKTLNGVVVPIQDAFNAAGHQVDKSPVVLISNLVEPRGVTIDHSTGSLYVTLLDGTLFEFDVAWLSAAVHTGGVSTSSNPTNEATLPYTLPSLKMGSFLTNKHIPSVYAPYIHILVTSKRSNSRTSGVSVAPLLYRNNDGLPWKNKRIFMTDTNQNKISMGCSPTTRIPNANVTSLPTAAISHQVTSPTLDIDISSLGITNMAAFWPTSIIVLLDTGSGATDEGTKHADAQLRTATGSGTGVATTDTTNYIVYVTEYLGKIWKYKVQKSVSDAVTKGSSYYNNVKHKRSVYSIVGTPTLMVDKSHYQASIRLRELLYTAINRDSISTTILNKNTNSETGGMFHFNDDGTGVLHSVISSNIGISNTNINSSLASKIIVDKINNIYYDIYE